jgi:UDP-sulfoquinovose synthase
MRILIPGIDGYLGWPLAQYLTARGHEVAGIDNFFRRQWVEEMGSWSALPVQPMQDRLTAMKERHGRELRFWNGDLREYELVAECLRIFQPDAIVHLGECPSAPYSMIDREHAVFVQMNNLVSTFNLLFAIRDIRPQAHLVKLGTMGEYGTPNVEIPEGFFEVEYRGRRDRLPFPRMAGSWYHWSKVHGSNNIMFGCKIWNLRATDVMQGVVFGTRVHEAPEEVWLTRLDFDQAFGTAINRFCCQAVIGHPLTLFGQGHQKRGFLPLRDSMQCLTLALEHPPQQGEYRVLNQFEEVYDLTELAEKVRRVGATLNLDVAINHIENPRREMEQHFYQPDHQRLRDLGYRPTHDVEAEMAIMIKDLMAHRRRIEARSDVLIPDIRWDGTRRKSHVIEEHFV